MGRTGVIVTFVSGETEQFVSVTVVNDNTLENTEEFTAVLNAIPGSTIGAADTATATITDDDSKPKCHPKCHPGLVCSLILFSVNVTGSPMQLAAEVFVCY